MFRKSFLELLNPTQKQVVHIGLEINVLWTAVVKLKLQCTEQMYLQAEVTQNTVAAMPSEGYKVKVMSDLVNPNFKVT